MTIMRRILSYILCFLLPFAVSSAQDLRNKPRPQKNDKGLLFINESGAQYKVLHDVITVKLKDSSKRSAIAGLKIVDMNSLGYMDLEVPEGVNIIELVERLRKHSNIETVDYNSEGEFDTEILADTFSVQVSPPSSDTSTDPFIHKQWYHQAINTFEAIDTILKIRDIPVVAIIDTGLEYTHADIARNLFINDKEIYNNGVDDDHNGFIDDYLGWNFYSNNSNVNTGFVHGTNLAGTIAATAHNQIGIRGITHNCVKIMPICIGLTKPASSLIDNAILYAVNNGADVINLSLSIPENAAISSAIEYAHSKGVTILSSSGNQVLTKVQYPAIHPKVIAVGGSTLTDERYLYSCYGEGLDFVAPGENIFTTFSNSDYGEVNGTSLSCAQASAVAGLMYAVNPAITPDSILRYIGSTCTKMDYFDYNWDSISKYPYGTWDFETGYGRINAAAAVGKAQENYPTINPLVIRLNNHVQVNYGIKGIGVPTGGRVTWDFYFEYPELISNYYVETTNRNNYKLHIFTNSSFLCNTLVTINIYNVRNERVCTLSHLIYAMSTKSFMIKEGVITNSITILNNQTYENSDINTVKDVSNQKTANVIIYSLGQNRQVLNQRMDLSARETVIDISQLASGLYAIQITDNDGITLSEKFVKR